MGKRFGDNTYAAEELITEIASAFLCCELGITQDTRADHAQYLAHWLKLLKDDSRAIFAAAAKASLAVDLQKAPANDQPGSAADVKQRMAQWRARNQGKDFGREL